MFLNTWRLFGALFKVFKVTILYGSGNIIADTSFNSVVAPSERMNVNGFWKEYGWKR